MAALPIPHDLLTVNRRCAFRDLNFSFFIDELVIVGDVFSDPDKDGAHFKNFLAVRSGEVFGELINIVLILYAAGSAVNRSEVALLGMGKARAVVATKALF